MIFSDANPVQFWCTGTDTFNETEPEGVFRKCFCQPYECEDEITIQFKHTIGQTFSLSLISDNDSVIDTVSFTEFNGYYSASFTPSSAGICDMDIQLKIYDSGDNEAAKSDCLSIKTTQKETILINYTNNRIFSGLSSSAGTPDPEFNLRIPGCFYHERFPTESEAIELSSGRNIQLNAQLTAQKLLEVGLVPYYMHKKIKLALMFQTVTIDGEEWVMTEAYEILLASRRSALKQAKVWLTEKDSTVRNIL